MDRTSREGYDRGHQEGLRTGLLEGTKVLKQLEGAIKDAVTQREILLEDAKRKILDLVVKISQKVTFDAIQVDPETTLSMINGVIDTLVDRSRFASTRCISITPRCARCRNPLRRRCGGASRSRKKRATTTIANGAITT